MPGYEYNNITQPAYSNPIQGAAIANYAGNADSGGFSPLSPQFDTSQLGAPNLGGAFNTDNLRLGLGAVQTLGSLWMAFKQNQLANKSLKLQTKAYETNLKNQTQSYNTALEDRIRARYNTENRSQAEADNYIAANRL